MNSQTSISGPPSVRPSTTFAWLLTTIAIGLAILSAALVFSLDIQRTGLQNRQIQLRETLSLRKAENQRLTATAATADAELERLAETYTDGKSDLAHLKEIRAKLEPLVQQSNDRQMKLESLIVDLLVLAKSDTDAMAIVVKYGIHQETPASPPGVTLEKQ